MTAAIIVLGVIMVVSALVAVFNDSLVTAIVASGSISLFASILYLILAAPDVSMTEAAITRLPWRRAIPRRRCRIRPSR